MSRSRKKKPVIYWACVGRKAQQLWKKQCRRTLRRIPTETELPNGGKYKIISGNIWDSPSDGKQWWARCEKSWRK